MVSTYVTNRRFAVTALIVGACALMGSASAHGLREVAVRTTGRVPVSDRWLCREAGRVVVRTTTSGVVLFRLPRYATSRFACLRGKRYAVSFTRPRDGTTNGTADLRFAGTFMTIQIYGSGCGRGSCTGPEAWLIDLRTAEEVRDGHRFGRTVRIRANAAGDAALIVRDSPGPDLDSGYPAGPGPFRVDVRDRSGRRTIDRGPGIDPASLDVAGRVVTWLHDGVPRSAMLAERPKPSARP